MEGRKKWLVGYLIFIFVVALIAIILFFMEAFSLRSMGSIDETIFGRLWVYILAGLALNLMVAFLLFLRSESGAYEQLRTLQQTLEKDDVTNLYGFRNFMMNLPLKLEQYHASSQHAAIVIVSIDDFKKINSLGGYMVGNEVLFSFADTLKSFANDDELVARYFGDEIIMLLKGRDLESLKERIRMIWRSCPKYIDVDKIEYLIRVSMGAEFISQIGSDLDTIINRATIAKVKAKENGGDCCEFYTDETDQLLKSEAEIEMALSHALENDEFYLVYQPIVDVDGYEITANEALLRWDNPRFKEVPIQEIIRIAEKTGIIREIGEWVLHKACMQNKVWQDSGLGKMLISVNISALQMDQPNFVDIVKKALAHSGLMAEDLQLEITETIAMNDVSSKLQFIRELKALGVKISIDDFGTGYSSFAYFVSLPIDNLKIDRSFIQDINKNQNSQMIVKTVINLAKGMNITTTAEGVEKSRQVLTLKRMECSKIQGYLVTRPLRAEVLEEHIRKLPMRGEIA